METVVHMSKVRKPVIAQPLYLAQSHSSSLPPRVLASCQVTLSLPGSSTHGSLLYDCVIEHLPIMISLFVIVQCLLSSFASPL